MRTADSINGSANSSEFVVPTKNHYHPSKSDHLYMPGTDTGAYAHNWSAQSTGGGIKLKGRHFVDGYGRICNLRGVNLSGSSKSPANHTHEDFPENPKVVTFVGRPFPLDEAHEHFSRLRRWGMTFIRFLVTWEAIEHEGPGIYDQEYLSYLHELLSLLPKYGICAFVSLHQDVWSRYSGGSGAPLWTLESVGLDVENFEETNAAWLNGMRGGGHTAQDRGMWPTGYTKLAATTMNTVFWAGDTFAQKLLVDDKIPIQQFLQNAFLNAWEALVKAVGNLEGVIGFQMINEPHRGYVDLQSMYKWDYNTDLHLSHMPSAFQSFQLGAGHPTVVPTYTRSFPMPTKNTKQTLLNPDGKKAWKEDGPTKGKCLWEIHGVWGWCKTKNQAVVLRENYFARDPKDGKKMDWYEHFYWPLLQKWAEKVENVVGKDKMYFVEPIPNEFCPRTWAPEHRVRNMVYAPHWYDLRSLFEKSFGDFTVNVQGLSRGVFPLKCFYWGQKGARDNFSLQIKTLVQEAYKSLGDTPVFIGECGIPMDMNHGEAFMTDNWTWQRRMMDAMITGLDRSLVGFSLWNYNTDNTDPHGDDWNGENFSWYSQFRALPPFLQSYDQQSITLDNGVRILDAIVRPYPAKVAGIPLDDKDSGEEGKKAFGYEMTTGEMWFSWIIPEDEEGLKSYETEIFYPSQLAKGRKLLIEFETATPSTSFSSANSKISNSKLTPTSSENYKYAYDESRQTLYIVPLNNKPGTKHSIRVKVSPKVKFVFEVNEFWEDWGLWIAMVLVVVLAIGFGAGMGIYAVQKEWIFFE